MVKVLDGSLKVSEFKLLLLYYVHFQTNTIRKGMNHFIPHSYGLNSKIYILL